MIKIILKSALAAFVLIVAVTSAMAINTYHLTDLGAALPDSFTYGSAINNHNQVACQQFGGHGFVSNGIDPLKDLDVLPGTTISAPYGITDDGRVVGYCGNDVNGGDATAVRWDHGIPTALKKLAGANFSIAFGVNRLNQAVGYATATDMSDSHPVFWDGNSVTKIGNLYGRTAGVARGINWLSQVVGYSYSMLDPDFGDPVDPRPFMWEHNRLFQVGLPKGVNIGVASSINDEGSIVGGAGASPMTEHASLWYWGYVFDLHTLPGDVTSFASQISNNNEIVGGSNDFNGSSRATYWVGDHPCDLNTLLDSASQGWSLLWAFAINDRGHIVGIGVTPDNKLHAYRLDPIGPRF